VPVESINERMEWRWPPVCPAAGAIADVRAQEPANVPGVFCRVTHSVIDPITDPASLDGFCCNPLGGCGGYTECPVWQFEKHLLWAKRKSFGDKREMEVATVRAWKDDLTGSEYGDTSFMGPINEAVDDTIDFMRQKRASALTAKTGTQAALDE
jgi:hypothetical protein